MKKITVLTVMALLCLNFSVLPQTAGQSLQALKVGDQVPKEFWKQLHAVYQDGKTTLQQMEQYKGKLLILDFWATWCSTCLGKFPLVDHLNRNGDMAVVLVNSTKARDNEQRVHQLFSTNKIAKKYPLPSIVNDTSLTEQFPFYYLPHVVWIDYRGVIIAITNYQFFTEANVNEVLGRQRRALGPFHIDENQ